MSGALLFDLDGTLVEADHLHHEAWRRSFEPHGVDLSDERYREEVLGRPNSDITGLFLPAMASEEAAALADAKEELFRSLAHTLEPIPGLLDFLAWADRRGARCGIVTNAPRPNAVQQLAGIGLADRFEVMVIGYELAHAKPHPLPYLTGLEKLDASAPRSLAFEDSLPGLASARAAGLMVVGLATSLPAQTLIDAGAQIAVKDYTDPRLKAFAAARLDGVIG